MGQPTKKGWATITSRAGKHKKLKEEDWVKERHDVNNSPNARDAITCPSPTTEDTNRSARKNKLLLQCSVREIHNYLHKPSIELPHVVVKDGKRQVSDTLFRKILPFELRPMANYLNQARYCVICESIQFEQDALNQWRKKCKEKLKKFLDSMPNGPTRN